MSKRIKKRNKTYQGVDAKNQGPVVHRYTAQSRGKLGEWWLDHKKATMITIKVGGSAIIIIWLLIEAVGLVVRS